MTNALLLISWLAVLVLSCKGAEWTLKKSGNLD